MTGAELQIPGGVVRDSIFVQIPLSCPCVSLSGGMRRSSSLQQGSSPVVVGKLVSEPSSSPCCTPAHSVSLRWWTPGRSKTSWTQFVARAQVPVEVLKGPLMVNALDVSFLDRVTHQTQPPSFLSSLKNL